MVKPIQIALLPDELRDGIVGNFASAVEETPGVPTISLDDFAEVAKQCEKYRTEEQGWRGSPFPSGMYSPDLCEVDGYRELKTKLGLSSGSERNDLRFADANKVMRALEKRIQPRWDSLDQLAAYEYAGLVLARFLQKMSEADVPNEFVKATSRDAFTYSRDGNTSDLKVKLPIYDRHTKRIEVREVELRFQSNPLQAANVSTFEDLKVMVDGRRIRANEMSDVLPSVLEATEQWGYATCNWSLFYGGLITFGFDSSKLNEHARQYLNILADVLKKHPSITLTIEGYADSVGTSDYNQKLGEKRGEAVRDYLARKIGHQDASKRLVIFSHGEDQPVDTEEEESKNRYNRNVQIRLSSTDPNVSGYRLLKRARGIPVGIYPDCYGDGSGSPGGIGVYK